MSKNLTQWHVITSLLSRKLSSSQKLKYKCMFPHWDTQTHFSKLTLNFVLRLNFGFLGGKGHFKRP